MIYKFQKPIYDALRLAFHSHQLSMGVNLPIRPRNHRLIIGPTGTGKTHIASQVARELNWACFNVNVSSWVVVGAKETPTWRALFSWASTIEEGRPIVIILDELDKVSGEDSWTRFLRAELFSLIGGQVPPIDLVFSMGGDDDAPKVFSNVSARIRSALVIGCGAFQNTFEAPPPMGFNPSEVLPPKPNDLSKSLQRELVNRFHQDILALPKLTRFDYEEMLISAGAELHWDAAEILARVGSQELDTAVDSQSSARFVEGVLARVFEELSKSHTLEPWVSTKVKSDEPVKEEQEVDLWDEKMF